MVAEGEGRYRPVEVELGAESNGRSEIRKGLQAGQSVVVSGQFLLDSEASLRSVETRSTPMPAPAASAAAMGAMGAMAPIAANPASPAASAPAPRAEAATAAGSAPAGGGAEHRSTGRIESIDADGVMLEHPPIPTIRWGSMTMLFLKPKAGLPAGVRPGAQVEFSFRMTDDGPLLTRIEPAPAKR